MERNEIIERATELQSKEDLLHLLNDLLIEEKGESCTSLISIEQISYYSNPSNIKGRFRHFSIPKKSGGKRTISAPCKHLKRILHYVNVILAAMYQPSEYAMGFAEGRSVVDNAVRHIEQNYVFNTDIENFFPSVHQARVWKRLQLAPFNFCQPVANVLAGLCSVCNKKEDGNVEYVLPQGAPTSPILTNAICDNLDRKLSGLARRFGLHYTRYADDITFSSMHNVYQEEGEFRNELVRILEGQGFKLNAKKTRLQKVGQRQEVTGLVVSSRVNTPSNYVAELRTILHIWERYGYKDAYKSFYKHYTASKGHVKKGVPMLENVIYGKLQYLKMVKGEKDPVYSALQARYNKLASPLNADQKKPLDYLHSYTLDEFEDMVGNRVEYVSARNGNIYGRVLFNNDHIVLNMTLHVKAYLYKQQLIDEGTWNNFVENCLPKLTSSKSLPILTSTILGTSPLYVVSVSHAGRRPFWMLTHGNPVIEEGNNVASISKILNLWEQEGLSVAIIAYDEGRTKGEKERSHDEVITLEDYQDVYEQLQELQIIKQPNLVIGAAL